MWPLGNGESGLIDQNGATILPFQQQELLFAGLEYNVRVERDGKWGVFDAATKKMVLPVDYDTVMTLHGDSLHLFGKKKDSYHVYRTNGKLEKMESEEAFRKRAMMRFVPPMMLMDVDENEIRENLGEGFTLDKRVRMGSLIYFPYYNQQNTGFRGETGAGMQVRATAVRSAQLRRSFHFSTAARFMGDLSGRGNPERHTIPSGAGLPFEFHSSVRGRELPRKIHRRFILSCDRLTAW